ncbi:MAG: septal ring lytic transglycosylase RlpA family protein [Candidatus Azobacteroides sp.]|nr:septal ring lytic transglycosylase RlpA family protein [Candidatus Azobacteroides sp.]
MVKKLILFLFFFITLISLTHAEITGQASYYADRFHGRKTASGEIFNMYEMTAAHRSLPFGTLLYVTNLSNNKSIVVRVTDRGPYAKKRILDLSYAAANELGFVNNGVTNVKIRELSLNEEYLQPIDPGQPELLAVTEETVIDVNMLVSFCVDFLKVRDNIL